MRTAWLSDIHLEFLSNEQRNTFFQQWATLPVDQFFLTGDISTSEKLLPDLQAWVKFVTKPLYFVLGNHDYYGATVQSVRQQVSALCQSQDLLHWLPDSGLVQLSDTLALVGHGGWSDGRYGDFLASNIILNDYLQIIDLADNFDRRLTLMQHFADEAAAYLQSVLTSLPATIEKVIVLTHVPPFQETCYYNTFPADDANPYLPHFTSQATGEVLLKLAHTQPDLQIEVLCGHTHHPCDIRMRPNLRIRVAHAEYEQPCIQDIFDL
ncbi:metallophosphoesterase [Anaerolineales bacterium]